jgi:hypothetical protein
MRARGRRSISVRGIRDDEASPPPSASRARSLEVAGRPFGSRRRVAGIVGEAPSAKHGEGIRRGGVVARPEVRVASTEPGERLQVRARIGSVRQRSKRLRCSHDALGAIAESLDEPLQRPLPSGGVLNAGLTQIAAHEGHPAERGRGEPAPLAAGLRRAHALGEPRRLAPPALSSQRIGGEEEHGRPYRPIGSCRLRDQRLRARWVFEEVGDVLAHRGIGHEERRVLRLGWSRSGRRHGEGDRQDERQARRRHREPAAGGSAASPPRSRR